MSLFDEPVCPALDHTSIVAGLEKEQLLDAEVKEEPGQYFTALQGDAWGDEENSILSWILAPLPQ